jgi:hypothetical protein
MKQTVTPLKTSFSQEKEPHMSNSAVSKREKDMSGAMFKNERKLKPEHPDFNGSVCIEGRQYWLSGWKHTNKNNEAFVTFSFKFKSPKNDLAEGADLI